MVVGEREGDKIIIIIIIKREEEGAVVMLGDSSMCLSDHLQQLPF